MSAKSPWICGRRGVHVEMAGEGNPARILDEGADEEVREVDVAERDARLGIDVDPEAPDARRRRALDARVGAADARAEERRVAEVVDHERSRREERREIEVDEARHHRLELVEAAVVEAERRGSGSRRRRPPPTRPATTTRRSIWKLGATSRVSIGLKTIDGLSATTCENVPSDCRGNRCAVDRARPPSPERGSGTLPVTVTVPAVEKVAVDRRGDGERSAAGAARAPEAAPVTSARSKAAKANASCLNRAHRGPSGRRLTSQVAPFLRCAPERLEEKSAE